MKATEAKLCEHCKKPYPGIGKYHPLCRKPAYAAAKAAKEAETYKGARKRGPKRNKAAIVPKTEELTPEQLAAKEAQREINKSVDEKYSPKLETKIYKKGTPEFNSLAAMYMAKEQARRGY